MFGRPHARRQARALAGVFALLASLAGALATGRPAMSAEAALEPTVHAKEIGIWRQQRVARLTSEEGWLVVSGLFWLKEGENRFGSDPKNPVVLPAHSSPPQAGVLRMTKGKVTLEPAAGVPLLLAGKPAGRQDLADDLPGPPDVVSLGDARFFVIDREGRMAIRLRDLKSPRRTAFKGIDYFPIRGEYRVTARFVPHPKPKTIAVPTILRQSSTMVSPGAAHFRLNGKDLILDALLEEPGDNRLFFIFRDQTAAKETYGAGRFLYTDLPRDGTVVIDFNKAYTPPCGYTPFATCPLPPPQNHLRVRIEAGEKWAGQHP